MSSTLYFFNGSAFPISCSLESSKHICDTAQKMTIQYLREGGTIKKLGDFTMNTMIRWERMLCEAMEGGTYTPKKVKKWVKMISDYEKKRFEANDIEYNIDNIQLTWNSNILILLKLKRIQNDENNGTLTMMQ